MSFLTFISSSERYTQKVAQEFARTLKGDEKICLIGPLGSGKTSFVRGFAQAAGVSPADVMSPTFTLVREYDANGKKLYHVDLYRLEKEDEIFEAGIYDLISRPELVLVEWADRLGKFYPPEAIQIRFAHGAHDLRIIEIDREP